jgi:alpha-tubulin suppressor-like RCC1 family protein
MRSFSPFRPLLAPVLAGYLGCADLVEVLGPPLSEAGGDAGAPVAGAPGGEGGGLDRGGQGGDGGGGSELPRVVRLDSGYSHTCAVLDGALYCWGQNQRGRLGVGDTLDRLRPTRVGAEDAWRDVTTGSEHSCALREDGAVYCFGANDNGQLGIPGVNDVLEPMRVDLPNPALSLSTEVAFTCALLDDGALYCWGANIEGQLGQADTYPGVDSSSPLRVTEFSDFMAVDAGQGHACALRAPGAPQCWGRNTDSQLGLGPGAPAQTRVPGPVLDATDFTAISAGQNHSCALRGAGELVCWGGNDHGNLGTGDQELRDSPTTILAAGIVAVSLDTFHTCALDQSGALSCWGRNIEGQLGAGDTDDRLLPTPVAGPAFERVAVGRFFTCAVSTDHRVLCTGANESGQLGFGDTVRRSAFEALSYPFE